ncbi:MAG: hypothetical protein ABIK15_05705 [Pseudomonadota bacterium]
MADELKIDQIEKIIPDIPKINPAAKRKKRDKNRRDEAGRHFQELARKAEQAHSILSEKKSPYRFCVYQAEGEVLIDIAIIDADGKIKKIFKRNITNDEFQSWIQWIESETGMILDKEA